jgi:hypothetical protein
VKVLYLDSVRHQCKLVVGVTTIDEADTILAWWVRGSPGKHDGVDIQQA